MRKTSCPHCGHEVERFYCPDHPGEKEAGDDLYVCGGCAEICVFTKEDTLRELRDYDDLSDVDLIALAEAQRSVGEELRVGRMLQGALKERNKPKRRACNAEDNGAVFCFDRSVLEVGFHNPNELYAHCGKQILMGLKSGTRTEEWELLKVHYIDADESLESEDRKRSVQSGAKLAQLTSMMSRPETNIEELKAALANENNALNKILKMFDDEGVLD